MAEELAPVAAWAPAGEADADPAKRPGGNRSGGCRPYFLNIQSSSDSTSETTMPEVMGK